MAILAKENTGGDFTPMPEGTYLGRCVHVFELGHIYNQRWGSTQHKVMIGFEIIDDSVRYKNKDGDEVHPIMYWEGTVSLSKKSNLRPLMESWFGKTMSPEALSGGFDVTKAIGHPAMIGIKHSAPNENNRIYANISSVQKPLNGVTVPPAEHEQFVYEIEMLAGGTWSKLPDWIKKKIEESSQEFQSKMKPGPAHQGAPVNQHPVALNPELVNDPSSEFYVPPSESPF